MSAVNSSNKSSLAPALSNSGSSDSKAKPPLKKTEEKTAASWADLQGMELTRRLEEERERGSSTVGRVTPRLKLRKKQLVQREKELQIQEFIKGESLKEESRILNEFVQKETEKGISVFQIKALRFFPRFSPEKGKVPLLEEILKLPDEQLIPIFEKYSAALRERKLSLQVVRENLVQADQRLQTYYQSHEIDEASVGRLTQEEVLHLSDRDLAPLLERYSASLREHKLFLKPNRETLFRADLMLQTHHNFNALIEPLIGELLEEGYIQRNQVFSPTYPAVMKQVEQHLWPLKKLDLTGRGLFFIPSSILEERWSRLEILVLNDNPILELAPASFIYMRNLKKFECRNSLLSSLPSDMASYLPHLEEIDLGFRWEKGLPLQFVFQCPSLKKVVAGPYPSSLVQQEADHFLNSGAEGNRFLFLNKLLNLVDGKNVFEFILLLQEKRLIPDFPNIQEKIDWILPLIAKKKNQPLKKEDVKKISEIYAWALSQYGIPFLPSSSDEWGRADFLIEMMSWIEYRIWPSIQKELRAIRTRDSKELRDIQARDSITDSMLAYFGEALEEIGKKKLYKEFQSLDFRGSKLPAIPSFVASCLYLEKLDISQNQIQNLKPLLKLPHLKELNASSNQISAISEEEDLMLHCLEKCDLNGNPLNREQIERIQKGLERNRTISQRLAPPKKRTGDQPISQEDPDFKEAPKAAM